jgi:DNA-binding response OmpR family regulator
LIKTLKVHFHYVQTTPNEVCVTLDISTGLQIVLIVDDNPDAVDLFHRYLAKQPYQILVADTGAKALQFAREAQPDIIILDIMLPEHDGMEVLQTLKHDQATRNIPILVCSVLDMQPLARSLGADDYLKKPPGQQELLTRLEQWRA